MGIETLLSLRVVEREIDLLAEGLSSDEVTTLVHRVLREYTRRNSGVLGLANKVLRPLPSQLELDRRITQLHARSKAKVLAEKEAAAMTLQTAIRAHWARSACDALKKKKAATTLQRAIRTHKFLQKIHHRQRVKAARVLQRTWRRHVRRANGTDASIQARLDATRSSALTVAEEMERLRAHFLPEGYVPQILWEGLSSEHRLAYGRTLEAAEFCKETHYHFTHAQDLDIAFATDILSALLPDADRRKYFRVTAGQKLPIYPNKDEFLAREGARLSYVWDRTPYYRHHLMSVDANLINATKAESAISFFDGYGNIISTGHNAEPGFVSQLILNVLRRHSKDEELISSLHSEAMGLVKLIQSHMKSEKYSPPTRMNLILIPKEVIRDPEQNLVFRTHSVGRICKCDHGGDIAALERAQRYESVGCLRTRYGKRKYVEAQYRLLTENLDADSRVEVMAFDAAAPELREAYAETLERIVDALS